MSFRWNGLEINPDNEDAKQNLKEGEQSRAKH
jgi:hypothetical protein